MEIKEKRVWSIIGINPYFLKDSVTRCVGERHTGTKVSINQVTTDALEFHGTPVSFFKVSSQRIETLNYHREQTADAKLHLCCFSLIFNHGDMIDFRPA
jgi:hypothetical protein